MDYGHVGHVGIVDGHGGFVVDETHLIVGVGKIDGRELRACYRWVVHILGLGDVVECLAGDNHALARLYGILLACAYECHGVVAHGIFVHDFTVFHPCGGKDALGALEESEHAVVKIEHLVGIVVDFKELVAHIGHFAVGLDHAVIHFLEYESARECFLELELKSGGVIHRDFAGGVVGRDGAAVIDAHWGLDIVGAAIELESIGVHGFLRRVGAAGLHIGHGDRCGGEVGGRYAFGQFDIYGERIVGCNVVIVAWAGSETCEHDEHAESVDKFFHFRLCFLNILFWFISDC